MQNENICKYYMVTLIDSLILGSSRKVAVYLAARFNLPALLHSSIPFIRYVLIGSF